MSDKRIDEWFHKVVEKDAEEQSHILMEQRSEAFEIPESSRQRFEKMLDDTLSEDAKQQTRRRAFGVSRTVRRILVAAAACIVILFGLMMTSEAVRSRITQFFVSFFQGYAEIKLDNIEQLPPSEEAIYALTYIPDGYVLVREQHLLGQQMLYKRNDEDLFHFDVETEAAVSQADTESAIRIETVDVQGETGLLIVYDGWTNVTWSNETNLFTINGTISAEDALKMANSVTVVSEYPTVQE